MCLLKSFAFGVTLFVSLMKGLLLVVHVVGLLPELRCLQVLMQLYKLKILN